MTLSVSRLLALSLLLLGPALACAGSKGGDPFKMVSVEEVEKMMSQPDVAIIDANPKDVFEKGHVPGATHYKSKPFAEVLPREKSTKLVFYCASPS